MNQGKINVQVENIFPLIKKFLYSDHEIFLRELISNATDATLKLRHLCQIGQSTAEYGDPIIEVRINKEAKTLHILDQGLGMTAEEVEKYINQVAFSGANEFLEKYKDSAKDAGIIGHFGLGFYSAFMVAKKVEIITKSHTDAPACHWTCDGSPEYTLTEHSRVERGTEIILHIADDSTEFLEAGRIRELLNKYSKFMPIPIKFGTRKQSLPLPEGAPDDAKPEEIEVDDIINITQPAWTRKPTDLKDEDYKEFYRQLYPMQWEDPLFHIHLNVDFPFNLTGILYFPKLSPNLQVQKDRIQLYQNQVFITDNVEGIVPEFLTMLRGVIDSPDIPLNVSRSYLQADSNVKKISEYITKKVAEKLHQLFKEQREDFEKKWNDIKIVIEYGMLSEPKFYDKAIEFALMPDIESKYYTWTELKDKIDKTHKNKDNKVIVLYASDREAQHSYIAQATQRGYTVLMLDSPLVPHWIQKIEQENPDYKFSRVDAEPIDKLIQKDDTPISKLSDSEKETLKKTIEDVIPKASYTIVLEPMSPDAQPMMITQPEFMRRMKDMQATGGGGFMSMGGFPDMYNLVINENHPLATTILQSKDPSIIQRAFDLARLSQNLLKGEELSKFISDNFARLV